jgi:hypothetical protein
VLGSGHIDISKGTISYGTYVLVTGVGTPDDLNWIDGAGFNGQYLIVQGTASQVINIKHATTPGTNGNIVTPDGNDIVLDGTVATNGVPVATFIFDVTVTGNGAWRAISTPVGVGGEFFGPWTADHDAGNQSLNNLNDLGIVRDDGVARMNILGGTGAATDVVIDTVVGTNIRFTEGLADRFEIKNDTNTIQAYVGLGMNNQSITAVSSITSVSGLIDHIFVNTDATNAGFNDSGHTADPSSGVAGDFYYNTTSNTFKFYNGSIWSPLGTTSFIGFLADADLDMNDRDIDNVENINMVNADGTGRMVLIGGATATSAVRFDVGTNVDWTFSEALSDRLFYDASADSFEVSTGMVAFTIKAGTTQINSAIINIGDAPGDAINFIGTAGTELAMGANKITGVLNPTNPQDAVTLDYFNTTGDGQWLETDGTGTMSGNINLGDNDLVNANNINVVNADSTARMAIIGGATATSTVRFDLVTNTDWILSEALSDRLFYDASADAFQFMSGLVAVTISAGTTNLNSAITNIGDAPTDTINFIGEAGTALEMDAHKITGLLNPTNPQDAMTLDYFNTTGDTQWLETDGTGAMVGTLKLRNPADTFSYEIITSAITVSNKTVTLPLLTANDTFIFRTHADTLSNKTIDSSGILGGPTVSLGLSYNNGVRQTFNPNATIPGLNFGSHTADPSTPTNGDVWYNSTTNKFRARENGSSVDMIGGGGGSQTPWASLIDGDGFELQDVGAISWRIPSGIIPAAAAAWIGNQADSFVINAPTGDDLEFRVGGVNKMTVANLLITMTRDLEMSNNNVQGLDHLEFDDLHSIEGLSTSLRIIAGATGDTVRIQNYVGLDRFWLVNNDDVEISNGTSGTTTF